MKGASSRVADLVAEVVDGAFAWDPLSGTLEGYGRYDGQLGSASAETVAAMVESCRRWQAEADRALATELSPDDRTDLLALGAMLAGTLVDLVSIRRWERDPNWYGDRIVYGCWALLAQGRDEARARRSLISRLGEVPRLIGEARDNLVRPLTAGVQSALAGTRGADELLRSLAGQLSIPGQEGEELAAAAAVAADSLAEFCRWLEADLAPRATDDPGIPTPAYERLLRDYHGLTVTVGELLAIGEQQVRSISERLRHQALAIRGDDDWRRALADTAVDWPEPAELVATYRAEVERTIDFLSRRQLVTLPANSPLVVEETPAFARMLVPYGAYLPAGSFAAADRPGRLWVTPIDEGLAAPARQRLLTAHNRHSRLLLALHEGYPGHHLQFAVARQSGRPARCLGQFPTFIEGWAFYCEQMLVEEGLLREPGDLLWQLRDELWRAARIVIDVSYHCRGMTVTEGQRYLAEEVGMEPEHALAEAQWYAARPSYPMAYMMGKREILDLRRAFLERHRSLREFHDRLLATGGLPIRLAAERLLS